MTIAEKQQKQKLVPNLFSITRPCSYLISLDSKTRRTYSRHCLLIPGAGSLQPLDAGAWRYPRKLRLRQKDIRTSISALVLNGCVDFRKYLPALTLSLLVYMQG